MFDTGEYVIVGWCLEEDVKDGGRQCGSLEGVVAVVLRWEGGHELLVTAAELMMV